MVRAELLQAKFPFCHQTTSFKALNWLKAWFWQYSMCYIVFT